jgi:hypothetical protein
VPGSSETAVERARRKQVELDARQRMERDLAAIKARVQNVRDAIRRGEPMVAADGSFNADQLGLRPILADEWGRLWRSDCDRLVLIFSPAWFRLQERESGDGDIDG